MALSVSTPINPGRISGVDVAHPGTISGVSGSQQPPGAYTTAANSGPLVTGTPGYGSIYASGGPAAPVLAPTPDIKTINANAAARANTTAGNYYNTSLNSFLQQQAQQQATQQAIKDQAVADAQQQLKNTQQANEVTGQRTTADTATKLAQQAQAVDWRQTDQGGQYDIDRVAQAAAQARSGTTGSGLAAGQQASSQDKFNTTESRQATGDQQQQAATELAKARTFEDLATSNTLAGQKEASGEKAAQFNLSSFIQGQSMDLLNKQQELKVQQANQAAQIQANLVKQSYQDFFSKISNPAQKAAFAQAYGSFL